MEISDFYVVLKVLSSEMAESGTIWCIFIKGGDVKIFSEFRPTLPPSFESPLKLHRHLVQ